MSAQCAAEEPRPVEQRPCRRLVRALRSSVAHVTSTILHPHLRATTAALCLAWAAGWFTYFGAILITPKLLDAALSPANVTALANATATSACDEDTAARDAVFVSSVLATVAEVPGLLVATYGINKLGRVKTTASCMLVAGLTLVLSALSHVAVGSAPPSSSFAAGQLVLVAFCRMAAFGGFSSLYVLTAESFPTPHRATAFGACSAASRLAGTVTPFVAGSMWAASPSAALLCYAAVSAASAAVLLSVVPESSDRAMPDDLLSLVPAGTHIAPGAVVMPRGTSRAS